MSFLPNIEEEKIKGTSEIGNNRNYFLGSGAIKFAEQVYLLEFLDFFFFAGILRSWNFDSPLCCFTCWNIHWSCWVDDCYTFCF